MAKVQVLAVTGFGDGSVASMAGAFREAAEGLGHTVVSSLTGPSCGCTGCGYCSDGGCGDPDCLCTFRNEVAGQDAVAYALPTDGNLRMSDLRRILDKTTEGTGAGKVLFLMSCSPSFSADVFMKVSDVFADLCRSKGWEFRGQALVEGLPDACQGGDPLSRRKAAGLAGSLSGRCSAGNFGHPFPIFDQRSVQQEIMCNAGRSMTKPASIAVCIGMFAVICKSDGASASGGSEPPEIPPHTSPPRAGILRIAIPSRRPWERPRPRPIASCSSRISRSHGSPTNKSLILDGGRHILEGGRKRGSTRCAAIALGRDASADISVQIGTSW